jgi:hypothetical protein
MTKTPDEAEGTVMGSIYSAAFSAIAVAAAQDVFEIVAPAGRMVTLREVRLGQASDAGDAQAELVPVTLVRGHTTSGAGGAAVTPAALRSGDAAASVSVARNNTTPAQDGSAAMLLAEAWNVQAPYLYRPDADARIVVAPGERLVVRIGAPADALTMSGTLVFEEGR